MRALIEDQIADGAPVARLSLDLARGGITERLHARSMPAQPALWQARAQHLVLLATIPWIAIDLLAFAVFNAQASGSGSHLGYVASLETRSLADWPFLIIAIVEIRGWRVLLGETFRRRVLRVRTALVLLSPLLPFVAWFALRTARHRLAPVELGSVTQLVNGRWLVLHEAFRPGGHPLAAELVMVLQPIVLYGGLALSVAAIVSFANRISWDVDSIHSGVQNSRIASLSGIAFAVLGAVWGEAWSSSASVPLLARTWPIWSAVFLLSSIASWYTTSGARRAVAIATPG